MHLGLVGAGFHARTNIVPALAFAGIPVAGLATRDLERSREALRLIGSEGAAYGSAAELLADPAIDAVAVIAQPADQTRIALEAIDAGKAVFVDKPLGWTGDEADRIAERADAAGTVLRVGFMKRHAPVYRRLRQLVQGGELGTVRSFSLRFTCDSTPFCADEEEYLKLAAIHLVDLVRFVFGEVATVAAIGSGEGARVALSVLVGFESGVAGTLDLTGLPSGSSETETLHVTGDTGYAQTVDAVELRVHRTVPDAARSAAGWLSLAEHVDLFRPAESAMSGTARDLHLRGFVGELTSFAAAVAGAPQTPTDPPSDAQDNARTMHLIDRIQAAGRTH